MAPRPDEAPGSCPPGHTLGGPWKDPRGPSPFGWTWEEGRREGRGRATRVRGKGVPGVGHTLRLLLLMVLLMAQLPPSQQTQSQHPPPSLPPLLSPPRPPPPPPPPPLSSPRAPPRPPVPLLSPPRPPPRSVPPLLSPPRPPPPSPRLPPSPSQPLNPPPLNPPVPPPTPSYPKSPPPLARRPPGPPSPSSPPSPPRPPFPPRPPPRPPQAPQPPPPLPPPPHPAKPQPPPLRPPQPPIPPSPPSPPKPRMLPLRAPPTPSETPRPPPLSPKPPQPPPRLPPPLSPSLLPYRPPPPPRSPFPHKPPVGQHSPARPPPAPPLNPPLPPPSAPPPDAALVTGESLPETCDSSSPTSPWCPVPRCDESLGEPALCRCPGANGSVAPTDYVGGLACNALAQGCLPSDPDSLCHPGSCMSVSDSGTGGFFQCVCPDLFLPLPGRDAVPTCQPFRGTGFDTKGPILEATRQNALSRLYSVRFNGTSAKPSWSLPASHDWRTSPGVLPPVTDTGQCGASWAFAAAAAIDAAWAITFNTSAPLMSRQQLLDCAYAGRSTLDGACLGGHPRDALEYAAGLTALGSGLRSAAAYPFQGMNASQCFSRPQAAEQTYSIQAYEAMNATDWRVLAAAVSVQPLVVAMVGSQPSFLLYNGTGVYKDPSCYDLGSDAPAPPDHAVLLVGFSFPADGAAPFWVIQNSWGAAWGDGGYGYLAIQDYPGVCGMSLAPALYPVIQGAGPCGGINPCGAGTCQATASGGARCSCPWPLTPATNSDASQTCVPAEACNYAPPDVCGEGSCVDGPNGSYACSCSVWEQDGTTAEGNPYCSPADVDSFQYILAPNDTCDSIARAYSISVQTLSEVNKQVNCSAPVPGTYLSIFEDPSCSDGVTAQPGETCQSVCDRYSVPSTNGSYAACHDFWSAVVGDPLGCLSGDRPIPPFTVVCVSPNASVSGLACSNGYVSVRRGDTCMRLLATYYRKSSNLFYWMNGERCQDKRLWLGRTLCLPM